MNKEKTVLERYAEYLRDNDLMTKDDETVWREFLKIKYGIPTEEEEENGQEA